MPAYWYGGQCSCGEPVHNVIDGLKFGGSDHIQVMCSRCGLVSALVCGKCRRFHRLALDIVDACATVRCGCGLLMTMPTWKRTSEKPWHAKWKAAFSNAAGGAMEVRCKYRRADAVTAMGIVVEVQGVPVAASEVRRRQAFYTNAFTGMVWVFPDAFVKRRAMLGAVDVPHFFTSPDGTLTYGGVRVEVSPHDAANAAWFLRSMSPA